MLTIYKTEEEVLQEIKEISNKINLTYKDTEVHFIKANEAGNLFFSHLSKTLEIRYKLHELKYEKYDGNNLSGEVKITKDIEISLFDKDVIILDGIFITGRTPSFILKFISARLPKTVNFCILAKKNQDLVPSLPIPYCAFDIPTNINIVGFGIGEKSFRCKLGLFKQSN